MPTVGFVVGDVQVKVPPAGVPDPPLSVRLLSAAPYVAIGPEFVGYVLIVEFALPVTTTFTLPVAL